MKREKKSKAEFEEQSFILHWIQRIKQRCLGAHKVAVAVACKGLRLFSHAPLWFSSPFPSPHPIPYGLLAPLQRMGNTIGPRGLKRTIKMPGACPATKAQALQPRQPSPAGGETYSQPAGRVQNFWAYAMIWVKAGSWFGAAGDPGSAVCTHAPAVLQSVG